MSDVHIKTVLVRISGRVQGVWFRGWTREAASNLRLNGWVRNRSDGTVEALFSGKAEAVEDMLRRCKSGPSAAYVDDVEVCISKDVPASGGFRVRTTF